MDASPASVLATASAVELGEGSSNEEVPAATGSSSSTFIFTVWRSPVTMSPQLTGKGCFPLLGDGETTTGGWDEDAGECKPDDRYVSICPRTRLSCLNYHLTSM